MLACYDSVVEIERKVIAKFGLETWPLDADRIWREAQLGHKAPVKSMQVVYDG